MKKRSILVILLLLLVPILILESGINTVNADSGFDASYDSGGYSSGGYSGGYSYSGWSSSDYSYGSSSRRHSSNRGSYSYSSATAPINNAMLLAIVVLVVIFMIFLYIIVSKGRTTNMVYSNNKNNVPKRRYLSDEEVRRYIPDFDYFEFIEARYQDYVAIQNAWSTFNYNVLREKLTDELYNQYIFQLDTMKIKREQNIMSGFTLTKGNVIGIREKDGKIELTMEMIVSFYDYIVCDGNVTRGSKTRRININYEITFVCDKTIDVDKCPNCHAPLKDNSSQVCEYCRTVITRTGRNWVMSKKINRSQW